MSRSLIVRSLPYLVFACLIGCSKVSVDSSGPVALPLMPAFETRIDLSTSVGQHADMVLADFTGDAVVDIVVAQLSGGVELLTGRGNGTFASTLLFNPGGRPIAVASADLDGDLDLDLVVLRTDAEQATVYLNDGLGGFSSNGDLPVGGHAVALVIGDHDGDSILDIIVSRVASTELVVYAGTGGGNFVLAPGLGLPGDGEPFNLVLGDVSGDGREDLVVCDRENDRLLIYVGTPSGLDPDGVSLNVPGQPVAVAIGDLSGDGRGDMAVSIMDSMEITVITDWTASGPMIGFTIAVDGTPANSIIADVTGDGLPDLVPCVTQRSCIAIFPGQPGGGLRDEIQMDAYGEPFRPAVADVDLDGRPDLLVLSGQADRLSLYLGRDGGGLHGARNYATGLVSPLLTVAAEDFDGDGAGDVVVGSPGTTTLSFLSTFEDPVTGDVGLVQTSVLNLFRSIRNAISADLNGDGKMDLIVAVEGGVNLLRNVSTPGNVAFEILPIDPAQVVAPGSGPFEVTVEDMDGDRLADLVIVDWSSEKVFLLRATSTDFTYQPLPLTVNVSGGPIGVTAADFDGDGIPDLAVSRNQFSMISIYRNDGSGQLTHAIDLPVGLAPNYLRGADFNRDGRTDLVVSNGGNQSVSVLFAQAGMSFSLVSFPAGHTPTALLVRDLNDDGYTDILVASLVGADFRILLGDGRGGFPNLFPFAGARGVVSAAMADMNRDGLPDLLLASLITTRVSLYENLSSR